MLSLFERIDTHSEVMYRALGNNSSSNALGDGFVSVIQLQQGLARELGLHASTEQLKRAVKANGGSAGQGLISYEQFVQIFEASGKKQQQWAMGWEEALVSVMKQSIEVIRVVIDCLVDSYSAWFSVDIPLVLHLLTGSVSAYCVCIF